MLKLHGFAVSNYFNMVRMALIEKGVPFEVVTVYPSQEESWLSISPMGKVPVLETPEGFLSETSVILDYIEDTQPGPRFLPTDPFARARAHQAVKIIELYVELQARRLFGGVFFGGTNPELTVQEAEVTLRKGIGALSRVLNCGEYTMGNELTIVDFVATFTFSLASQVAKKVYDWDIVADVPGLGPVLQRLNARASVQQLNAEAQAAMPAFIAAMRARG